LFHHKKRNLSRFAVVDGFFTKKIKELTKKRKQKKRKKEKKPRKQTPEEAIKKGPNSQIEVKCGRPENQRNLGNENLVTYRRLQTSFRLAFLPMTTESKGLDTIIC